MQRLQKELIKLTKSPPAGISVVQDEFQRNKLEACISGPEGTPYAIGIFRLEILVSDQYPITPPSVKFITKVYHPNIDDSGRICLDLLKMPPNGGWKPIISIEKLLVAIRMLLQCPNPDDPLMADVGREFSADRKLFEEKAAAHCLKYAARQ